MQSYCGRQPCGRSDGRYCIACAGRQPRRGRSFAVLAQQNSAVTPEQVEALISQIGTVTRSRRAAIVAALDAYNQLDDAGKTAVTNFGVLAEAQQILGIQDALAKCNVNYDAVEDCWAITTPHDDSIDKRKTCGIGPNLYIWDKGNTIVFWEDFTYMGSSELDIDDIILRGGDYKYTYICDYDNSGYGYDKELGKWFAWATFEMEDSEVEWLRNLLSADTVIMRFEERIIASLITHGRCRTGRQSPILLTSIIF